MEDLKNIIKEVIKIANENKINVEGDTILDCSTRIFISNNISSDRKEIKDKSNDITEKQKYYLEKKGYVVPDGMTKFEASKAIEELKSKEKK